MAGNALILEFNELCPPLLDRFIGEGRLPNFKKLRDRSQAYVTHTTDKDVEPWVQWVTFHLGLSQAEHGITNLDEGHLVRRLAIWDDLAAQGKSSFLFGAMNTGASRNPLVNIMPDAWSAKVAANDPLLEQLHLFTTKVVQEHANPAKNNAAAELLALGPTLIRLGLSPDTVFKAGAQLVREKLSANDETWRRAAIFDRIIWDVFQNQFRARRPNLSIFFSNATAHFQHRYWRHMDPNAYNVRPSDEDIASYSGAIEHGYRQMDWMIAEAFKLAGDDTSIVLATALSQNVNPNTIDIAGRISYRPPDFDKFLRWCGITDHTKIAPVMSSEAWVDFASAEATDAAAAKLDAVAMDGFAPVMGYERRDNRLLFACQIKQEVPAGAMVRSPGSNRQMKFEDLFTPIGKTVLDASHNRDGVLWIEDKRKAPKIYDGKLPLEEGKALVLDLFETAEAAPKTRTLARAAS